MGLLGYVSVALLLCVLPFSPSPPLSQKTNFSPSCTWRDVVAVCVMRDGLGIRVPSALNSASTVGVAKLSRLNRLKISTRNWRFCLPIGVFLKIDRSIIFRSGPRSVLRPTLPYSPGGGSTNAFALYQLSGEPAIALPGLNPGAQSGFCGFGSLERSFA